jgi:23S rRNA pseudouridine1911/1915/1917 synthase
MNNNWISFEITEAYNEKSIRTYLSRFFVSSKKIYKLSIDKSLKLNHKIVDLDTVLKKGDLLEIDESILMSQSVKPTHGDLDIVYQDDDILVVNKPVETLVYSDGEDQHTLTNYVSHYFRKHPYPILPVHRIDYDTSGLVVFAKHPIILSYMSRLFEENKIDKTYVCLVENVVQNQKGTIDKPIGKDRHENKMRVSSDGKPAKTTYEVIKSFDKYTKLKVNIHSGRKHQIRVHLRSIGLPIVSDQLYGHKNLAYDRLMLHFERIGFIHPRTFEYIDIMKKAEF